MLVSKVFAHHYRLTRNHRKLKAQEGVGGQRYGFFFYFTANNYCQGSQASFRGLLHAAFSTSTSLGFDNPRNQARRLVFGVFDLPGLQPPSTSLNNPRNRGRCLFSTSLGFDNPQQSLKSSAMLGFGGFRPPWASTSLHVPQQPPKSSAVLVFNLPGLQQPSATPEIERDAQFLGGFRPQPPSTSLNNPRNRARCSFSTSLGFDNP